MLTYKYSSMDYYKLVVQEELSTRRYTSLWTPTNISLLTYKIISDHIILYPIISYLYIATYIHIYTYILIYYILYYSLFIVTNIQEMCENSKWNTSEVWNYGAVSFVLARLHASLRVLFWAQRFLIRNFGTDYSIYVWQFRFAVLFSATPNH